MARHAMIWKSQEHLTKIAPTDDDKLSLEDRLRVRIALKVMRKAHVHGSRAEKDRQKMKSENIIERLHLRQKKKPPRDLTPERQMYSVDIHAYEPKTLEHIKFEAKACSAIKRERTKMERESLKYGKVRPIFPELIGEIKNEFRKNAREEYRRDVGRLTTLPSPFRKQLAQEALARMGDALETSNLLNHRTTRRVTSAPAPSSAPADSR